MSPLLIWVLSLLIAVVVSGVQACESVLPDESLLEQFGNFVGEAFRAVGGNAQARPAAAVNFAQPMGGGVPSEKDRTEHHDRLKAYSSSLQAWLAKSIELTDAQQASLRELSGKLLEQEVSQFGNQVKGQQPNNLFAPTFPILFTKPSGIAADFSKIMIELVKQDLLSEEQRQRLENALAEREELHRQAYLSYIVSMFDKELFLSTEQRAALSEQLTAGQNGPRHPLYAFQPQSYYLPYESLGTLLPLATSRKFLDESQEKRLLDLTNAPGTNQNIVFQSSAGLDEWQKQITEAGKDQRDRFLRATVVRVTYYQKELHLTPEQSEHLLTAGKGAAVRAVGDWKESTQQTIDQMEQQMAQMGGNFGFGTQSMNTNDIDQNPVWAAALNSLTSGAADQSLQKRKALQVSTTSNMLLASLDDELWLMPEQRKQLQTLIQKSLPKNSDPTLHQEYVRDVVLLAFPLFKSREQDRNEILTEPQRVAWKQLQSFFQWQQQGNHMQIPLRNQGGSFGFMLSD